MLHVHCAIVKLGRLLYGHRHFATNSITKVYSHSEKDRRRGGKNKRWKVTLTQTAKQPSSHWQSGVHKRDGFPFFNFPYFSGKTKQRVLRSTYEYSGECGAPGGEKWKNTFAHRTGITSLPHYLNKLLLIGEACKL